MSRVVVVGAGVGGLTAAARLAAVGHAVVVCEAGDRVGGKLGTFERDGFRFDTGPSLLTLPQAFEDLDLPLRPVEPIARYRFADGTTLETTADREELRRRMAEAFGPRGATEWDALLARASRMWDAVEGPVLHSPAAGVRGMLRLAQHWRDIPVIAPHRTLRGLGRELLHDPRQRQLLERYATYTGSDPRQAPAALATDRLGRDGLRRLVRRGRAAPTRRSPRRPGDRPWRRDPPEHPRHPHRPRPRRRPPGRQCAGGSRGRQGGGPRGQRRGASAGVGRTRGRRGGGPRGKRRVHEVRGRRGEAGGDARSGEVGPSGAHRR